jgi:hypothetical protein
MSRPLRLEFAGALYYIASRGNGRNLIYLQDDDFELFLQVLADVCERYNWVVHAYCLMSNHYHLLVGMHDGVRSCILHIFFFKLWLFYSYLDSVDVYLSHKKRKPNTACPCDLCRWGQVLYVDGVRSCILLTPQQSYLL